MGRIHKTIVTHLEMLKPQRLPVTPHPRGKYALMRAENIPIHFYRYLYDTVGRHYVWVSRRVLSDDELSSIIHHTDVEIYILYMSGAPVGFTEIDFRNPQQAELCFLGVTPECIGQGLGRFLLHEAIQIAWLRNPPRLAIQTCTLDHPNALRLYQRYGFTPYAQAEAEFEEP